VPVGVALSVAATGRVARQELPQARDRSVGNGASNAVGSRGRAKSELDVATVAFVEELRYGCAAELISDLEFVFVKLPRIIVNELPVVIHAPARHRGG